jgi:hypothetical protein
VRPSKPKVRPNKALERLLKEVGNTHEGWRWRWAIRRRVEVEVGLCRLWPKISN